MIEASGGIGTYLLSRNVVGLEESRQIIEEARLITGSAPIMAQKGVAAN